MPHDLLPHPAVRVTRRKPLQNLKQPKNQNATETTRRSVLFNPTPPDRRSLSAATKPRERIMDRPGNPGKP